MKWLFTALLFVVLFSGELRADTIDYWHVYRNGKILKKYSDVSRNPPVIINSQSVTEGDSISVLYGNDTPCDKGTIGLYVVERNKRKDIYTSRAENFKLLTVSLKKLLLLSKARHENRLDIFYFDCRRNTKIFRLIFR